MTQIYIKQNKHEHRTQNFRRISPFGITPVEKAHKARTRWYRGPFRRFINNRYLQAKRGLWICKSLQRQLSRCRSSSLLFVLSHSARTEACQRKTSHYNVHHFIVRYGPTDVLPRSLKVLSPLFPLCVKPPIATVTPSFFGHLHCLPTKKRVTVFNVVLNHLSIHPFVARSCTTSGSAILSEDVISTNFMQEGGIWKWNS